MLDKLEEDSESSDSLRKLPECTEDVLIISLSKSRAIRLDRAIIRAEHDIYAHLVIFDGLLGEPKLLDINSLESSVTIR